MMEPRGLKTLARATALLIGLGVSMQVSAGVAQPARPAAAVHVDGRRVVVVKRRPPAVIVDVRTSRPSRRHVWIDGHWQHRRGRFVWVKGHWAVRPHRRAVYVRPRWSRHDGGWVLIGGYWR